MKKQGATERPERKTGFGHRIEYCSSISDRGQRCPAAWATWCITMGIAGGNCDHYDGHREYLRHIPAFGRSNPAYCRIAAGFNCGDSLIYTHASSVSSFDILLRFESEVSGPRAAGGDGYFLRLRAEISCHAVTV